MRPFLKWKAKPKYQMFVFVLSYWFSNLQCLIRATCAKKKLFNIFFQHFHCFCCVFPGNPSSSRIHTFDLCKQRNIFMFLNTYVKHSSCLAIVASAQFVFMKREVEFWTSLDYIGVTAEVSWRQSDRQSEVQAGAEQGQKNVLKI